jgi:hypothetical protein
MGDDNALRYQMDNIIGINQNAFKNQNPKLSMEEK